HCAVMVTFSNGRMRHRRLCSTSSSNSAMQGPHQVAHTMMKRSLTPESWLARMAFSAATYAFSSVTGSAALFALKVAYSATLSAHFTEQPNTRVDVTGGSLP